MGAVKPEWSHTPCGEAFSNYYDAEIASRRRPHRPNVGFMIWRCYRCPDYHIGPFSLDNDLKLIAKDQP